MYTFLCVPPLLGGGMYAFLRVPPLLGGGMYAFLRVPPLLGGGMYQFLRVPEGWVPSMALGVPHCIQFMCSAVPGVSNCLYLQVNK